MGNTILLVTHENDIAAHARRTIRLRDGEIESDVAVEDPELEGVEVTIPNAAG